MLLWLTGLTGLTGLTWLTGPCRLLAPKQQEANQNPEPGTRQWPARRGRGKRGKQIAAL